MRGTHSVDSLWGVLASSEVDGMGVTLFPESVDISRGTRARGVEGPNHVLGGVEGSPDETCFSCLLGLSLGLQGAVTELLGWPGLSCRLGMGSSLCLGLAAGTTSALRQSVALPDVGLTSGMAGAVLALSRPLAGNICLWVLSGHPGLWFLG